MVEKRNIRSHISLYVSSFGEEREKGWAGSDKMVRWDLSRSENRFARG